MDTAVCRIRCQTDSIGALLIGTPRPAHLGKLLGGFSQV